MAICNKCGQEIEFRYVDGRCIPIHPGGGWHCGSFSEPSYSPPARVNRSGEWQERDFTRPTRCPKCDKDVFFIRHNGGSVWVDPPLGWPWPKHGCFDQPHEPTRKFSMWTAKSSGLTNPKLGIIARVRDENRFEEPIIEIQFTDSSRASLILRFTPATSSLLGALVIVSTEDSLLLHQEHAEIPFHSFTSFQASGADGYYTCPHCKSWVKKGTGHEESCAMRYGKRHSEPQPAHKRNWLNEQRIATMKEAQKRVEQLRRNRFSNLFRKPQPLVKAPQTSAPTPKPALLSTSDRVRPAIDSVARAAWAAVADIEGKDEQFKLAKQEALRLIAMLSPSIKRQVMHRFTSEKWKPLLVWRPFR